MSTKAADVIDETSMAREQIPSEIVAVIAAAAAVLLGSRIRIRSVEQHRNAREPLKSWSQQGRAYVQASHNLRQTRDR